MHPIYVVTDIEADGPDPGRHSMLSFASVAVQSGAPIAEFEAVLQPLPEMTTDPDTARWWLTEPEAYKAATENAEPAAAVMSQFVSWVRNLAGPAVFTAHPLAFDGPWIDYYLKRFEDTRLISGPWAGPKLFIGPGLCLRSYIAGRAGLEIGAVSASGQRVKYPADWLGHHPHTHRAIDDARGYASLLITMQAHRVPGT
jgi:DNA polymerase III epsilon subunit-like protein